MKIFYIFFVFFLCFSTSQSQNQKKIDSLTICLKKSTQDSSQIKILNKLSSLYYSFDLKQAEDLGNKALALALKINNKTLIAESQSTLADVYYYQGKHDKSKKFYLTAIKINREINNQKGLANCFNGIGYVFREEANYPEAVNYYQQSIKIYEALNDQKGIARTTLNIGVIYSDQGKQEKAIEYQDKALQIFIKTKDIASTANTYARLGNCYSSLQQKTKAVEYYNRSLELFSSIHHQRGIAVIYNNLAGVYDHWGDKTKAIDYYSKALKIRTEIGDKNGTVIIMNNLGILYSDLKNFEKSLEYLKKSRALAEELNYKELMKENYSVYANLYEKMNNYKLALEFHKKYYAINDSIYNEQSSKQLSEITTKYETEKKEQEIEILNKEKAIQNLELSSKKEIIKKQTIIIVVSIIGIAIVLLLSIFLFRLFRAKQKANIELKYKNNEINQQKEEIETQRDHLSELNEELNQQKEEIETQRDHLYDLNNALELQKEEITTQRDEIEKQRDEITEKKNEITDSIYYAQRIQKAILSKKDFLDDSLKNYFILFKPKDIVSGDFYWASKQKNKILIAVADCTGHGVPGAFMSMLGVSFLNEIVARETINSASQVLNALRNYIIISLQQKGISGEQKDGMDITFVIIDSTNNSIQYAGANSSLYIITKQLFQRIASPTALNNGSELIEHSQQCIEPVEISLPCQQTGVVEMKGDKQPVAIFENMIPFTNHEMKIEEGNIIYLFSDGYVDQFGGSKGKKFMHKQFKELLLTISQKPMAEQKLILENTLNSWKSSFDQVDDITVMGIKF